MVKKLPFKPVDPKQDFIEMEKKLLDFWYKKGVVKKYLKRNQNSKQKFSFLDGPITANNPMGVHHAWGRTYKDLWQRFYNMAGHKQRFQNGFDEQGLWVEVEVEKELGFKNKKDIEKYGIDKFVQKCKERVKNFAQIQTEQSKRLGYFMDWQNSYHTSSEENNYAIWNFLKACHKKGYLYKGRDCVPWCPRCGTAISQHEILTEQYKELTHKAVYIKYRIKNSNDYLLVWTTTPWTLPSNVAIAVNPDLEYGLWDVDSVSIILNVKRAKEIGIKNKPKKTFKGKDLVGLKYEGNFDDLAALKGVEHKVVAAKDLVTQEEGTGLVHIAPGAGEEDFKLAKDENLAVVESIDESANYIEGFGDLASKNAEENPNLVIDKLKERDVLFRQEDYTHRYPTCWRCKTELVWRVVDEWYIAMDRIDPDDRQGRTLRYEMVEVAKKINWIPKFGLERELDWLKNMHDWLISKKRYWGLALPIWECEKCGNFEVIASKDELKEKALEGWQKFEGNSPHRPWVDHIKIKCTKCQSLIGRVPDVGNPWLDAGIVPFSTMPADWFPADFITESFPGQFKNWFYSLIAMSTVIKNTNPFKTVLGFATLLDEKGEEMHKSKSNAIEFNEAADKIGVDVMRWMYTNQNPANNLLFGYHKADDVRRRYYLILWNCYKFFASYANLANWTPAQTPKNIDQIQSVLDSWAKTVLNRVVISVNESLNKYDAQAATRIIENFVVNDLSTWYIRRSRDRVGPTAQKTGQNIFLSCLYGILETLSRLIAPFMPFIAEEIYQNITGRQSVHLQDYPIGDKKYHKQDLIEQMARAREIVEMAHAARKETNTKVRQPLTKLEYPGPKLPAEIEKLIAQEINVLKVKQSKSFKLVTKLTPKLKKEGEAREIIRSIQQARKEAGCELSEFVTVTLTSWPKAYEKQIKQQTLAAKLVKGESLKIKRD